MAQKALEERVDMLERRVELLEQLPERVTALEVQIVQLRDEMRAEFSATRAEAREGDEETPRVLRDEIRAGDQETRRFMRVLHEDLVARIEILGGTR
jgi:predicted phage gp36 major capsid-like protein